MKNIFVCLLLVLFCMNVQAQDSVYAYKKKFKNGFQPKAFNSFSVYDEKTGNLHLTLVDNKSIERITIDSNWKTISNFSTARGVYSDFPYNRFDNLQLIATDNKEYNIYNTDNKFFFVNEIDYGKEEEKRVQKFELKRKETLVEAFATNSIFCVVVAEKNSDNLKFITNAKSKGTALDTITANFDFIDANTSLAKLFEGVSILREEDRELEKLILKSKIYLKGNTVFITIDKLNATYVSEVSLISGEVRNKIFIQQVTGAIPIPKLAETFVYNSFLYGNILVNGNMYNDEFTISFYDYAECKLLNKYSVGKSDNINFKDGPLINRKGKEISTKDFIKRAIKEGNIIFEVNKNGGSTIELLVAICDVRFSGGLGGAPMPMGVFPGIGGGFFVGFTFGGGGTRYTSYEKDANFKSTLNVQTLQVAQRQNNTVSKTITSLLQEEYEKLHASGSLALCVFKKMKTLLLVFMTKFYKHIL
jgi:hypothetical protein